MPWTTENPTCEFCGRIMEVSSVGESGIEYKCAYDCELWAFLKTFDASLTEEELKEYAAMGPDFFTEPKPYQNHCWNCKAPIHSDCCKKDPIRGNGYICNRCGKSLRELKALCALRNAGLL